LEVPHDGQTHRTAEQQQYDSRFHEPIEPAHQQQSQTQTRDHTSPKLNVAQLVWCSGQLQVTRQFQQAVVKRQFQHRLASQHGQKPNLQIEGLLLDNF
jgi:hypothetical protein